VDDTEVLQCGSTKVTIPRHREINEITARAILRLLSQGSALAGGVDEA